MVEHSDCIGEKGSRRNFSLRPGGRVRGSVVQHSWSSSHKLPMLVKLKPPSEHAAARSMEGPAPREGVSALQVELRGETYCLARHWGSQTDRWLRSVPELSMTGVFLQSKVALLQQRLPRWTTVLQGVYVTSQETARASKQHSSSAPWLELVGMKLPSASYEVRQLCCTWWASCGITPEVGVWHFRDLTNSGSIHVVNRKRLKMKKKEKKRVPRRLGQPTKSKLALNACNARMHNGEGRGGGGGSCATCALC